jgi:hypothetical protein
MYIFVLIFNIGMCGFGYGGTQLEPGHLRWISAFLVSWCYGRPHGIGTFCFLSGRRASQLPGVGNGAGTRTKGIGTEEESRKDIAAAITGTLSVFNITADYVYVLYSSTSHVQVVTSWALCPIILPQFCLSLNSQALGYPCPKPMHPPQLKAVVYPNPSIRPFAGIPQPVHRQEQISSRRQAIIIQNCVGVYSCVVAEVEDNQKKKKARASKAKKA